MWLVPQWWILFSLLPFQSSYLSFSFLLLLLPVAVVAAVVLFLLQWNSNHLVRDIYLSAGDFVSIPGESVFLSNFINASADFNMKVRFVSFRLLHHAQSLFVVLLALSPFLPHQLSRWTLSLAITNGSTPLSSKTQSTMPTTLSPSSSHCASLPAQSFAHVLMLAAVVVIFLMGVGWSTAELAEPEVSVIPKRARVSRVRGVVRLTRGVRAQRACAWRDLCRAVRIIAC